MDEYSKSFMIFSLLWLSVPVIFSVGYLLVVLYGGVRFHIAPIMSLTFLYVSFLITWNGFRKMYTD